MDVPNCPHSSADGQMNFTTASMGEINYTVWSDAFALPKLWSGVWDVAVMLHGKVYDKFKCPAFAKQVNKA